MSVIVIGGGIVGASAAYHLVRRGVSTTLVDAARPGQATAAGAGVVFPWPFPWEAPQHQAFALRAAAHYPALMRALEAGGRATGYRRVGGMSVGTDPLVLDRDAQVLADLADLPGYEGVGRVRRLERGEPRELFPPLPEDFEGVHVEGMARVNGAMVRDALFTAAEERGLRYLKGAAELVAAGGRVSGVRAAGEELAADAVVIAAGAWTAELLRPFAVDVPVYPVRGQIVHTALPGAHTRDWPVLRFPGTDQYMLGMPPDRVILSGTREPWAGFDHRATVDGVLQGLSDAVSAVPALGGATVVETRVGFRPGSRDDLQLLGPVGALPGAVVATGLGANGLTFGPYQGAVAATLAVGEEPEADISAFRPDRVAPDPGAAASE
ncbi:FAD-dependent oxidoreductase [Nocardiopsis sp. RSe5-2]|uniref:FAD-dependent oxidoreductase n=1 Tax=Nocardiopsis endophytica TaxID=3018445 RepID=A0ABT4U0H2_9ACTN|nr:FAD-dependent oxidoreductase [Nocardiopsis endophytica]MDA2809862.1 FAD-dependent oxidoreductase [Nocardiopsis endophytica]